MPTVNDIEKKMELINNLSEKGVIGIQVSETGTVNNEGKGNRLARALHSKE